MPRECLHAVYKVDDGREDMARQTVVGAGWEKVNAFLTSEVLFHL